MRELTLFINGCSVAQIKDGKYLIVSEDGNGMVKTDLQGFKKCLEKYRPLCENTWNDELRADYKRICEAVNLQDDEQMAGLPMNSLTGRMERVTLSPVRATEADYERQRKEDKLDLIEALMDDGMGRKEAEKLATETYGR